MSDHITAESIDRIKNQLNLLGPGPFLVRFIALEPVLFEHISRSISEISREVRSFPLDGEQRKQVEMRFVHTLVLALEPVLRTLHPPDQVAVKRAQVYRRRLDALNARAKAAAQDQ